MSQRQYPLHKNESRSDEQGYLASVSDLMATLLFIFIITLMAFVINLHEATTSAAQKEEDSKKEIIALRNIQRELTDARSIRQSLLEDVKQDLMQKGLKVEIDVDKGLLHVPEKILFPSGQANFAPGGEESLQLLGAILAQHLPCYSGTKDEPSEICASKKSTPGRLEAVLVEGHTDNVPIRTAQYMDNWQLSAARSLVTFRYLMQKQPLLETLRNANGEHFFGVSAYGETRGVRENTSDEGRQANRRIDLRFVLAAPRPTDAQGSKQ